MNLQESVGALLAERGLHGLERKRAESATKALVDSIGNVDMRCLNRDDGEKIGLGSLVSVPGDNATWVITGEYLDGTFDIMREGGMTAQDRLVGWEMGQSLEQYFGILTQEFEEFKETAVYAQVVETVKEDRKKMRKSAITG